MLGLGSNENRLNDASTKNMIVRTLKKVSELFEEKNNELDVLFERVLRFSN